MPAPAKRSRAARPAGAARAPATVAEFRRRLKADGKYAGAESCKPGTRARDGCLHDPPRLPPAAEPAAARAAPPTRGADGRLHFAGWPEFTPYLTPEEVLRRGAFGGTYFRDIASSVTGEKYRGRDMISEFPKKWFAGVDVARMVCSATYRVEVNRHRALCGASLGQWESAGWIAAQDPYGWFQWYCRFYLGRRSSDDARQVKRWLNSQGPTGRFWVRLQKEPANKVLSQVALHWANELPSVTKKAGGRAAAPPAAARGTKRGAPTEAGAPKRRRAAPSR